MISSLELFSGAGGLAKGLELSGAKHSAFVEWNTDACETLRLNYQPEIVHCLDIKQFDFSTLHSVDLIAGGPPCQPFSLGGKHKGHQDERDMFPSAVRAIRELMPKAFIFENVKGLLRQSFSSYFNYIVLQLSHPEIIKKSDECWIDHLKRLEDFHTSGAMAGLKYNVIYRLVNAADYGVPQRRERVVIVGIRDDLKIKWSFPSPTHSAEALLYTQQVTGEYWDRHKVSLRQRAAFSAGDRRQRDRLRDKYGLFQPDLSPWRTVRDAIGDLPPPTPKGTSEYPDHIFRGGARVYSGHTGSPIDEPSKTIKAGGHGVPGGENMVRYHDGSVRYFTVLEGKRIQTFPDEYVISGAWTEAMRQIGNAVPVRLGKAVSRELIAAI
jgi:DNA (cytosine-5)-methyltransferase 1